MADTTTPSLPKSRPQSKTTTAKKPKVQPSKIIFRLITKLNWILEEELKKRPKPAPNYMVPVGTVIWAHRNGKPLKLDTNLSDIYQTDETTGELLTDEYGRKIERDDIQWLPRNIRYLVNTNTIFEDEQNQQYPNVLERDLNGRNQMLDNYRNRDALRFDHRELHANFYDSVLWNYLWVSGQCENMHPKARRHLTMPAYKMLDFGQMETEKVDLGSLRRKAYELANAARWEELVPHAKHLNIPFTIPMTGEEREPDAIRADYVDAAYEKPKVFLDTFNDPKIKLMYQITRLKESNQLSINGIVAGQAHWMATKKFITMLPPDRSPIEFLADFSLTREGEEFKNQLEAFKVHVGL